MRWNTLLAAGLIGGLTLIATGASAAMTLRAGSVLPPTSDQGEAAEYFAERVKALTNGEIEIEVFHSGELGPPPTQYENLIAGAQDFVIDTIDYLTAYDSRMGIVNTPFVFRDRDHFRAFLNSDVFADIADDVEARGMVFIGDYGWMRQQDRGILSRTPINSPEDLQGYKLRMFQSEIPINAWSLMGANVQVIPWADVYTAIATGAVDGLTTQVSSSYLSKQTELLKNFTRTGEYYQIVLPIMSARSWNRLSDEQKAAIEQAAVETGEFFVTRSKEKDLADTKAAVDAHGLVIIESPKEVWLEAAEAIHRKLEERGLLPAGLVEQAQAIGQ